MAEKATLLEFDSDRNCSRWAWKRDWQNRRWVKNRGHAFYSTVTTSENTLKSLVDLKKHWYHSLQKYLMFLRRSKITTKNIGNINTAFSFNDKLNNNSMCRKFQFGHTNKWYMQNPAPVLENDTHKLLWDFNIQTDHIIPARRPDLIIITKKNLQIRYLFSYKIQSNHWFLTRE